jgi:iron-sulfur cluster repair protein YtfE (RIC family)
MKVTDAFLGEHAVFYAQFDLLESTVPTCGSAGQIRDHAALVAAALASHARLENDLLFVSLEPHLGTQGGPLAVMRAEHDEIEDGLTRIQAMDDLAGVQRLMLDILRTARAHFAKEEQILFPTAEQALDEKTLTRLGAEWAVKRTVFLRG